MHLALDLQTLLGCGENESTLFIEKGTYSLKLLYVLGSLHTINTAKRVEILKLNLHESQKLLKCNPFLVTSRITPFNIILFPIRDDGESTLNLNVFHCLNV